ncbi:MAG: efflux RND transporter permease subunit [Cytophagales bacterium]|nr:efflux RND transporter permease subunit [Bernardetiaceae bacterium]MDW8204705.1 efflux RND transporter permease subunit [Cytophagales bacterium]
MEEKKDIQREFGLSTLAIKNRTSVFILTFIIVLFGLISYNNMPKESFPEIVFPTVYVNTVYPGNSPADIENLVTRPIEKELKGLKGVKKITSTSAQDVSVVVIEFSEKVQISKALQDVKDAVDKAKRELPSDLDQDPTVLEVDLSEVPIVTVNLSGDFEMAQLKKYAQYLEDAFEALPEVSRVDITGALDREIQINADIYKMEARRITFSDIENAVRAENVTISGGEVLTDGYRRSMRISGEFKTAAEIADIIVKAEDQNVVYLKDVAEVKDSYIERKSYARLATQDFLRKGGQPVVSLNVIKRNKENLIEADAKIQKILTDAKLSGALPANLNIILTNNQADRMKEQISNLENSIIFGMILVVGVLLFFMGLRNAMFVGIAIPLSMLLSFSILSFIGATINIMILFSLVLALGMLVDNAIVVIENTYRLMEEGKTRLQAAIQGVGEVAIPIITSTMTTLAAFLPLMFWGGLVGEFMKFLPITLIVVLSASLFVGLVINPVVAATFMKLEREQTPAKPLVRFAALSFILSVPAYLLADTYSWGNIFVTLGLLTLINVFFFRPASRWFQDVLLTKLEVLYKNTIRFALKGRLRPLSFLLGSVVLMISGMAIYFAGKPMVDFFPNTEPAIVYMYIEAPLGTDVSTTNRLTEEVEKKVYEVLRPYAKAVKAIVTNVGEGTNSPKDFSQGNSVTPHKSKITINFVEYSERGGIDTRQIQRKLSEMAKNIPGLKIVTDAQKTGPPVGAPINIEIIGADYLTLIREAEKMKDLIEKSNIAGIDGLKLGIDVGKPELILQIDRAKAQRLGISTSMLAMNMRTAIYGKEISKIKDGKDDYPINLRVSDNIRYNLSRLNDQKITFRDNKGRFSQIPVSAVASMQYTSSFGAIKHKNNERLVTLVSNVTEGYNANEVVAQVKEVLADYTLPPGYSFKFTGEQEEQAKSIAFLLNAMLVALALIFLILVSQFNSLTQPLLVMATVPFSLIGVFLGLAITRADFVVIMTGIGIISLAGVVVNNAIVLIDCANQLIANRKRALGLPEEARLDADEVREALVQAGFMRLRPVLLTAITTVLGLIPLAIGLNVDFFGLYSHFNPDIYWGGQNADFWGPMAWTVVYGLTFSTFLTLVVVPVMYFLADRLTYRLSKWIAI